MSDGDSVPDRVQDFLVEWHRLVAQKDLDALARVLAEDVTLGAPPYWEKLRGRDLVHYLLGLIVNTIEGFTYHREWHNGGELALEFRGRVGGLELQGIDLISLDERSRIRNLDVVIRPINAVQELQKVITPKMSAFLSNRARRSG